MPHPRRRNAGREAYETRHLQTPATSPRSKISKIPPNSIPKNHVLAPVLCSVRSEISITQMFAVQINWKIIVSHAWFCRFRACLNYCALAFGTLILIIGRCEWPHSGTRFFSALLSVETVGQLCVKLDGWPLIRSALEMRHIISATNMGVLPLVAFTAIMLDWAIINLSSMILEHSLIELPFWYELFIRVWYFCQFSAISSESEGYCSVINTLASDQLHRNWGLNREPQLSPDSSIQVVIPGLNFHITWIDHSCEHLQLSSCYCYILYVYRCIRHFIFCLSHLMPSSSHLFAHVCDYNTCILITRLTLWSLRQNTVVYAIFIITLSYERLFHTLFHQVVEQSVALTPLKVLLSNVPKASKTMCPACNPHNSRSFQSIWTYFYFP